jgi:hypothetical protein
MKHRLYEGWIIARDELSPDQERELQLHLEKCADCKAFALAEQALERKFSSVQMLQPQPGFAQRWRARVQERQNVSHHRQTSLLLGLLSFGMIVMLMPLVLELILILISPEDLLFEYAKGAVEWLAWFEFIGGFVAKSIRTLISTIPVEGWLSIAVLLAGACTVWGFSLRRLGFLQKRKGV